MRKENMTNEHARRADIQARLDELNRIAEVTTDQKTLEVIAERKKVLRAALDSL